jgi:hypothetical protein
MTLDLFATLRECYHGQAYTLNGETYEGLVWSETNTLPKPTLEELTEKWNEYIAAQPLKDLRKERDRRLAEVDWIFSGDYQLSGEEWGVWTTYRQALRDLPSTTEDPANPVWPEKPPLPSGKTRETNIYEELESEKSKVIILQNVVYSLIKRVQVLENA